MSTWTLRVTRKKKNKALPVLAKQRRLRVRSVRSSSNDPLQATFRGWRGIFRGSSLGVQGVWGLGFRV